ncbi:MAG TPA: C40 family peptidase [Acidimicrobiia bacterium]|jgi:cell wall-associated NlpC family hydrolase
MSVTPARRGRARARIVTTSRRFRAIRAIRAIRAAIATVVVAGLAVAATAGPGTAAAPTRRQDVLATVALAWQRARVGVALAQLGLVDARGALARADATLADLTHQQDGVRLARHADPTSDLGDTDVLTVAVDLAGAARDRAAALAHDREVALYGAVQRADAIEALVAHEVARRGHADEQRLRAEWDRAPGRAVDAMVFALAQAGKPYVFAASGPAAYDCSGLTMAAWGSVGVHLTHFAATQYRETTRVAMKDLAPGDLVFFGSDLGHVGLYLGQHLMVHAPHTGDVVRVASIVGRGDVRTGRVRG